MTKFKYPVDGLYNPTRAYIDAAKSKITSAVSSCSLNAPASFSHRSYLNNLHSNLVSMKQELDVIERLIKKNDSSYKSMSLDIQSNMSKIELNDIQERYRMIK